MKVSTKGRYAIRMMITLGECPDRRYISLKEVSERIHVNTKYLEQIAHALSKAGLIQVMRGSAGGYRLCRRTAEYSALEILLAAEGSVAPTACLEWEDNPCQYAGECPSLEFWTELYSVIRDYLSSKSLKDIIDMKERKNTDLSLAMRVETEA